MILLYVSFIVSFLQNICLQEKLREKSNYTNLYFPTDYRKNVIVIYKYFKEKYGKFRA